MHAQPGSDCTLSSDYIDCICQMIKWSAVESREPLKHSFDGVSIDVCVCACSVVFACGLGAYFGGDNVRFALEETPCSSSQVISFRL